MQQRKPKLLIIRFSSIGDIVLTTPAIRCLKQQTDATIHYLTKRFYATILASNPYVDNIYTIDKKVAEVLPQLKTEQYDHIIDLHKNLRSAQVKRALGVPSTAFDKINWQKWLIVNTKINRLPDLHIVDRYLATAAPLNITNDGKGLDYFIPEDQEVKVNREFPTIATKPYLAFAIGAAHATKRLPTAKIVEICRKLTHPIILLGGPSEAAAGVQIAEQVGEQVINTCGKLSLHQSASLVRQAWKVITHDTGMMHIAAAFQKPIISIWGNTIPAFGMYPYYAAGQEANTTIEVTDLSCRPCSKIGHQQCPKGHFKCMQQIEVAQVIQAVNAE